MNRIDKIHLVSVCQLETITIEKYCFHMQGWDTLTNCSGLVWFDLWLVRSLNSSRLALGESLNILRFFKELQFKYLISFSSPILCYNQFRGHQYQFLTLFYKWWIRFRSLQTLIVFKIFNSTVIRNNHAADDIDSCEFTLQAT